MIKNKFLQFALYVVIFALMWNLMDFLWELIFTGSPPSFALWDHLILPVLLGAVAVWGTTALAKGKRKGK